ncbi:MAG: phosphate signaling complex protein PhoU [Alphaproteobacteria bacterium]
MNDHILSAFDDNIERLNNMLMDMANLAIIQNNAMLKAYQDFDKDLADKVIKADHSINIKDMDIDKRALRIILRHQPMAEDLRLVITAPKVSTNIERIADGAKAIAKMIIRQDKPLTLGNNTIITMGQTVNVMFNDVMEAWVERDELTAIEIRERDQRVDELYRSLFRELISWMIEDPRNITSGITALLAARYIERAGDHICNICEAIYFVSTGRRLERVIEEENDEPFDINVLEGVAPKDIVRLEDTSEDDIGPIVGDDVNKNKQL